MLPSVWIAIVALGIGTPSEARVRVKEHNAREGQLARDARSLKDGMPPEPLIPAEPRARLPRVLSDEVWAPPPERAWTTELHFDGPGYAINDQAPSWMALYERRGSGKFRIVKSFKTSQLVGADRVQWPRLGTHAEYRVQGILYFCKGFDPKASCVIQGVNHGVKPLAQASSTVTSISLKIPPKEKP